MSTGGVSRLEVYGAVGTAIRAARQQRGMTQAELAGCVDLTRTAINNIEHGRQRLSLQMVYDIADILAVPAKSLLPER